MTMLVTKDVARMVLVAIKEDLVGLARSVHRYAEQDDHVYHGGIPSRVTHILSELDEVQEEHPGFRSVVYKLSQSASELLSCLSAISGARGQIEEQAVLCATIKDDINALDSDLAG